jgi:hypothetical protein
MRRKRKCGEEEDTTSGREDSRETLQRREKAMKLWSEEGKEQRNKEDTT